MDDNKRAEWQPLKGALLVFLVLGTLGIAFFFWKYDDVFPAASVDLKLSKQEIATRARAFCKSMAYDTSGCVESTTFQEREGDPSPSTFLEHEYSMREANALMHSEICVYLWYTRFCKTHEEEEFQVFFSTDGRLEGLNHHIENERAITSVSQDEAMQMALKFVADKAGLALYDELEPGKPPKLADGIKLISQGAKKQSHRTDYTFTWEDQKHDYKGAHIRTTVDVAGNQIIGYDRDLHIPEEFERKFANMRSYNNLLKEISSVLFIVVGASMFFAFVWALSSKRVRWKLALVAAIVSLLIELLDFWNNWPAVLQSYNTTESLQGYLISKLTSSVIGAGMAALSAVVLVGGVEAVYRTVFPKKIAAEHFLNWKMLSNRTLLESLIAGIFVFGIHLGYVATYYLAGQKMGMWSPLELRDVSTISSIVPAFSSFAVGVNAGVSEELLYRVLCFVIAQRVFKNFWIANFVQAVGWAFMHSDYPQEPAYARGLELTIVGLFYGYLFKRFGVLTGIISHFIYDSFLGITPLLFAHSASLLVTGLLACSPPYMALAVGLWRRHVKLEDPPDEPLLNENLVPAQEHAAAAAPLHEERHLDYKPLAGGLKRALLVLCLLSLIPCVCVHPRRLGGWVKVTVPQAEVEKIAEDFLRERGVSESDWKVSSVLAVNRGEYEAQYGFEKLGFKKTAELMRRARIPMKWVVRFYKPLQRREYDVVVSSEGRPLALQVIDEENAAGKTIGQEDAHKLTQDFLRKFRPEFAPLQFDAAEEQKRKHRADFTVSYVVPSLQMADARFKIDIDTVGGLVSFPNVSWDIPDSWVYEHRKVTSKDQIADIVYKIVVVLLAALGINWAVGVFRAQAIHWRPVLITAGVIGMVTLISQANGFVSNLSSYGTDVPFASFLTSLAVSAINSSIMWAAVFAAMFAIGHGAFRLICPGVTAISLFHSTLGPPPERRQEARILWSEGALCAYAWILVSSALGILNAYLEGKYSPEVVELSMQNLVALTHFSFPALEQIMTALMMGFAMLCMAPITVGTYLKYMRSPKRFMLISFVVLALIESPLKYWQDYIREVGVGCIEMILLYLWIRFCARNNPVAYFLVGALNTVLGTISYLYKYSTIHSTELYLLCTFFALPLVIPFLFRQSGELKKAEG